MEIDHIFIFTNDNGLIANQLVEFGLTEGSNRIHAGQGTANRKFYFNNFLLEILWVHNQTELLSESTKSMGLWRHADFNQEKFPPFGLCLTNEQTSDKLFSEAIKYQPAYFPQGLSLEILDNKEQPYLPFTFRLPFKGQQKNNEPKTHSNGISNLTKTIFEHKQPTNGGFLAHFEHTEHIIFNHTDRNWLVLEFDNIRQGKYKEFKELNLTIKY